MGQESAIEWKVRRERCVSKTRNSGVLRDRLTHGQARSSRLGGSCGGRLRHTAGKAN